MQLKYMNGSKMAKIRCSWGDNFSNIRSTLHGNAWIIWWSNLIVNLTQCKISCKECLIEVLSRTYWHWAYLWGSVLILLVWEDLANYGRHYFSDWVQVSRLVSIYTLMSFLLSMNMMWPAVFSSWHLKSPAVMDCN